MIPTVVKELHSQVLQPSTWIKTDQGHMNMLSYIFIDEKMLNKYIKFNVQKLKENKEHIAKMESDSKMS